ncbi:DUF3429 domain-containing protein [Aureimonas psammosilenae]|uniref:DUF3429 domain-containing protein n=1 Tax=Aureimonas psammosilenae TaxID=2495496 RepID=UPI0012608490|nr:DUF3429 domain-containing protein [Aureimonas psammosilenae]
MAADRPVEGVTIRIDEPASTPLREILFAYAAMVPLVTGAAVVVLVPGEYAAFLLKGTLLWGAAIVLFLSGVRRGVSFRTPGGATLAQLAMMMWLFLAGFAAVLAAAFQFPLASGLVQLLAYASLLVLDPVAARWGEAPLYFARLRPPQMSLAVLSLLVISAKAGDLF